MAMGPTSLLELEERLKSAVHLYPVSARIIAVLAIKSLENGTHRVVMALLENTESSLEQIMAQVFWGKT